MYSSKFGEDWWQGGVCEQRNAIFPLSHRYGGDRESGKKSDGMALKLNFNSARLLMLSLIVILARFMMFRPELKEYIPINENVRYFYYNKTID